MKLLEFNIPEGIYHSVEMVVSANDTASQYGSGFVEVFATPAMIALMEKAAMQTVLSYLPEGFNTVGTEVCISHIKATPVGMKVSCKATLIKAEGKKLIFNVLAQDEEGEIGKGTHTRYIIDTAKFMERISIKKI